MNMQVKTKKTLSTAIISLFIISMLSVFATVPLAPLASAAPLEDLTPDYAKKGATIPILSFDIVGPAGGTTLTSVTIAYTGDALTDLSWAAIYISTDGGPWTLFGWIWAASLTGTPPTGTITGSYLIGAGVKATVKLTFTLSGTAIHGHTVDGKVTTYTLTIPPGVGTDVPPIDPADFTTIDNTNPTVTVTSPNGGEVWKGGDTKDITWTASDDDDFTSDEDLLINLEYSPNNGGTWILIAANEENDGTYSWEVPLIDSDEVLVRVTATDLAGNQGSDTSDDVFTIDSTAPTISDLTPANGAYVNTATPTISAKLTNGAAGIDPDTIVMTVDGLPVTHNWNDPIVSYTPATPLDEGEHTVTVDVSDLVGNAADTAEWSFTVDTIAPVVEVLSPNGGETWYVELSPYDITWTATDDYLGPNPITLAYWDGTEWVLIAANEENDEVYSWTLPPIIYNGVLVRVTATDLAGNQGSDTSDDVFTITYVPIVTTVDVTADPLTVLADGVDFSTITATVLDQMGHPMAGETVSFTTTLGTLSASSKVTGADGKASVTLTSTLMGTATVTATADSKSDTVDVEFVGVGGIGDVIQMLLGIKDEVKAIEAKLDNPTYGLAAIKAAIDAIDVSGIETMLSDIEAKLDAGGSFYTFVNTWFTTIDTEIDAIKAVTDTINWADITAIKTEIGDISADSGRASWTSLGVALDDIKTEIEEITIDFTPVLNAISGLDAKLGTFTTGDTVASLLYDIEDKLDAITAGAQAKSGSGTTTADTTIYTNSKVGTVTVSISTTGIGFGENVVIRYYINPANPTLYIQKTIVANTNTAGWTDTAAAWQVMIDITGTGTVNYAYSVIYPP